MEKRHDLPPETESAESALMLSLQCPACDWIWGSSFPCEVQGASPRCPQCAHQPVLVLKVYSI